MKLDTAADILEWAESQQTDNGPNLDDTETAAYLAYCVRVTAIVEREATEE